MIKFKLIKVIKIIKLIFKMIQNQKCLIMTNISFLMKTINNKLQLIYINLMNQNTPVDNLVAINSITKLIYVWETLINKNN